MYTLEDIDNELGSFIGENPFNAFAAVLESEGIVTPEAFGGNCYTLARKFAIRLNAVMGINTGVIQANELRHVDLVYQSPMGLIYISPSLHTGKSINLSTFDDRLDLEYPGSIPDKPIRVLILKSSTKFSVIRSSFSLDRKDYITRSVWEFNYPPKVYPAESIQNNEEIIFRQNPTLVARFIVSPTRSIVVNAAPFDGHFHINGPCDTKHDFNSKEGQELLEEIAAKSNIPVAKLNEYFRTAIDIFLRKYSADQG